MALAKQKLSFQVEINNTNIDVDTNKVVKCTLRLLPIKDTAFETNNALKYKNYFDWVGNNVVTYNTNKALMEEKPNNTGDLMLSYVYTNSSETGAKKTITPFINSVAPTPIDLTSAFSYGTDNKQNFLFYAYTPNAIESLRTVVPGVASGNEVARMKVQLVDESGVYADSDPLLIEVNIASGVVRTIPAYPSDIPSV